MEFLAGQPLLWVAIGAVLFFDYTNGFHDSSDMTASVVGCGAMSPARAVLMASFFTALGPLLGGTAVANAVGRVLDLSGLDARLATIVILAGICGAIFWNLLTWWFGIPSSSSHALVGGLVGATLMAAGQGHVIWGLEALWSGRGLLGFAKVVAALVISPLVGFCVALLSYWVLFRLLEGVKQRICRRRRAQWIREGRAFRAGDEIPNINKWLKRSQYLTIAVLSLAHGANDAQKSMGVIALLLLLNGRTGAFEVPYWVMLSCSLVITLGTLSGGWRIVRTLAFRVSKLRPIHGLDAQLGAGLVVFGASVIGLPVSTTHVVSSSIMGVGAAENIRRVKWIMALRIVLTWVITIPGSALVAGGVVWLLMRFVR
ncbi:MAG: inorganic phosphate transporter [Magnetococcales bacterium]|nr:inorganic phosphate transporter [Magnetococcales bacterium]